MASAVIYQGNVDALEGHAPFGDGECVALPRGVTSVGWSGMWRPGPRVVDLDYLNPGTVIANFVDGKFPSHHGFHAALFISFSRSTTSNRVISISVMDQFKTRKPKNIVKARSITAQGVRNHKEGNPYFDCDNADQFYVVIV